MSSYQNFMGIDIGKFTFVVALHGQKDVKEFENNSKGIQSFMREFKATLPASLVVLETTGGYEMEVLNALFAKKIPVHRANTRKVKSFIRSFGNGAKTDALDAKALARYGQERQANLDLFTPPSPQQSTLYALVQRRKDLKQMLVAEKNRAAAPKNAAIKGSCLKMIQAITDQISKITKEIEGLIKSDDAFRARAAVLETIPGIGPITSQDLLALMPELGRLTRRQVASLAGVAPRANDSGKFQGYRHTGAGRESIKPTLFLSAMAARTSHSELKGFYERLVNKGKKKMVALTALMRKIIVIANAKLKELDEENFLKQHS